MRLTLLLTGLLVLSLPATVLAAAIDAREVARQNNCQPKKIEIYQQSVGVNGRTTYKVDCTLAKGSDTTAAQGPDAVLINCSGMLCELLRPIKTQGK